jgi:hypothetical protein
MAKQNIDAGKPPILWDTIESAFDKINDNFTELYLTIGAGSSEAVDLTALNTSLIPGENLVYDLGSETKRWKDLYLGGSSIDLGGAIISSSGGIVNLPAGSTVGGDLIKDPIDASFKTVAVAGQSDIVADNTSDTLNVVGAGITLTTNASTDTLTITNAGVTQAAAGTGISVSASTGNITITNSGVTGLTASSGLSVSASTGSITITNTGVRQLTAGSGIILDASTGEITITNSSPNIVQNIWRFINVPGQSLLDPQNSSDTLTFSTDTGIAITTNTVTDTVTIANTGVTSLAASSGISVSSSTGSVTVANTGVLDLTAGEGISVSSATGSITIANTANKFSSVAVQGESPIIADNTTDTVTFIAGIGIVMTTDPGTDTITISAGGDNQSSIFSIGSTLLVDADNGLIVGDVESDSVKADVGVFGDKEAVDSGYSLHVAVGDLGITNGNVNIAAGELSLNGNNINDANLNSATGDFFGNVWAADSTKLVDWENGQLVGPVNTDYDLSITNNDAVLEFSGTGTHAITADNGSLDISAGTNIDITGTAALALIGAAINLGANGTDQVSIGAVAGLPLILYSRAPATSKGQSGDRAGMIAFNSTAIYYCKADWVSPGTADIWNRQIFTNTGVW